MRRKIKKVDRESSPGENIIFLNRPGYRRPYGAGLFLGPDLTGQNKVLMASFVKGWIITNLEGLEGFSRPDGIYNIKEKFIEDGIVIGYDYTYFENREERTVKVRMIGGGWEIVPEFEIPFWSR